MKSGDGIKDPSGTSMSDMRFTVDTQALGYL